MRIEIKARNFEATEELRLHVARRLHFALSRFSPEITRVVVRLDDINGPKGGPDKRCRLTARGPRVGTVTIEETNTEAAVAVDIAADRASRAVARALERERTHTLPRGSKSVRTSARSARAAGRHADGDEGLLPFTD